ncbi:hypothetical protein ARSU110783_11410 [Arcobacter suis]
MTIKLMKTKADIIKMITKLDNFIYEFGEKIL